MEMLPTGEIEKPAADNELLHLANIGAENIPFPITLKIDRKDIEKQLRPRKNLFQRFQKHFIKLEVVLKLLMVVLFFFIFIISIIHLCQIFHRDTGIKLYIPHTIGIENLSLQGQLLHKADYEYLLGGYPNAANYSRALQNEGDESKYSPNYYKEYSYMQRNRNLSLYIEFFSGKTSIATIIDRSITFKTVEEIYENYEKNSLEEFYHNLQMQQPLHILKNFELVAETASEIPEDEKIEYIRFLAYFIILFSPINHKETDYIGLNDSLTRSEELVNLLSTLWDGGGIPGLIAADATFSIISLIIFPPFLALLLYLELKAGFFYLSVLAILSFVFPTVIFIEWKGIIEVYNSLKPFSQQIQLDTLEKLLLVCIYYELQILLDIILIFVLYCSHFFHAPQEQ